MKEIAAICLSSIAITALATVIVSRMEKQYASHNWPVTTGLLVIIGFASWWVAVGTFLYLILAGLSYIYSSF